MIIERGIPGSISDSALVLRPEGEDYEKLQQSQPGAEGSSESHTPLGSLFSQTGLKVPLAAVICLW